MKYFIDFEATQYSNEIISVGCIAENGKTFNSLVKPSKLNKLTNFITELTGINKEMLETAPTSDEVFNNLFDFVQEDADNIQFYCYGNVDKDFVVKNLTKTHSLKAQMMLSTIAMNLIDYSKTVRNHFGLAMDVALSKVFHYYYPDEEYNQHTALADAIALMRIYKKVEQKDIVEGIPFPNHIRLNNFSINSDFEPFIIQKISNNNCEKSFENLEDAGDYLLTLMRANKNNQANIKNVKKKIVHAINTKKEYYDSKWRVKVKDND